MNICIAIYVDKRCAEKYEQRTITVIVKLIEVKSSFMAYYIIIKTCHETALNNRLIRERQGGAVLSDLLTGASVPAQCCSF